ncbi:MAG: hypothetical protein VX346_22250 [Planctomycetota bacterium]|nr:hypothetical protein [Planctomycetota bacterium]
MKMPTLTRRRLLEAAAAATVLGPGFTAFSQEQTQRDRSWRLDSREAFQEYGVVRLDAAVPVDVALTLRDTLYKLVAEEHSVDTCDPTTWSASSQGLFEAQGALRVSRLKRIAKRMRREQSSFQALLSATQDAVYGAFGSTTWTLRKGASPAMNLPIPDVAPRGDQGEHHWTVPRSIWSGGGLVDGQQLPWMMSCTVLLERSVPGGGGALAIPGSHRLMKMLAEQLGPVPELWGPGLKKMCPSMNPAQTRFFKSRKLKRALAAEVPWFQQLFSDWGTEEERIGNFMHQGCIYRDVPLKVVEFTGEPGDVILHSSGLNGLSANISGTPHAVMNISCLRA